LLAAVVRQRVAIVGIDGVHKASAEKKRGEKANAGCTNAHPVIRLGACALSLPKTVRHVVLVLPVTEGG
jgi:hypothetical protein